MAAKKKTVKKLGPQCDCIAKTNETLRKTYHPSLSLQVGFSLLGGGLTILIPVIRDEESVLPRRHPARYIKHVQANYCPFCGKKYNL